MQAIGSYIPTENALGGRAPAYLSDIVLRLTKSGSPIKEKHLHPLTGETVEIPVAQKIYAEAIKSRWRTRESKDTILFAIWKRYI